MKILKILSVVISARPNAACTDPMLNPECFTVEKLGEFSRLTERHLQPLCAEQSLGTLKGGPLIAPPSIDWPVELHVRTRLVQ